MGGPASSIFILLGLLVVPCIPVGLLLLFLGWRGKRAGNFPACGSCGFDVTGIVNDSAAKCPECGTALGINVKSGKRHKRLPMLLTGLILLLYSGGVVAVLLARGGWTQLNPHKPAFLLKAEIALGGDLCAPAVLELTNRIVPGALSRSNIDDLVQRALALQADTNRSWIPEYGALIETAHRSGNMTDADWKQYILTSLRSDFDVTTTVTAGDPIALTLKVGPCRTGFTTIIDSNINAGNFKIDGQPAPISDSAFQLAYQPNPFATTSQMDKLDSSTLSPGTHELEVSLKGQLKTDATVSRTDIKKFTIKVLPKGTPAHSMKSDPALIEQVRKSISIEKITLTELKSGNAKSDCTFKFTNLPMDVAFDLIIKYQEPDGTTRELVVASMAMRAMNTAGSHSAGTGGAIAVSNQTLNQLATGGMVTVEIRPSLEVAKTQTNMYEIWGTPVSTQSKVTVNLANPVHK